MRKELNSDHLCTVECCRGLIFIITLPGERSKLLDNGGLIMHAVERFRL